MHFDAANINSYRYSENLIDYSEQINLWNTATSIISTDAAVSPTGTLTAERIQVDPVGIVYRSVPTIPNTQYTFSFWLKSTSTSVTGTWGVNWYTGAQGHHRQTVPIRPAWNRVSFTFTSTDVSTNVYISDDRDSLGTVKDGYVWGAQIQNSPYPSNYIPTTGVIVSTSTSWTDISGVANTATMTVNPPYNPANGGCLSFNGTTTYVTITPTTPVSNLTNNFTTEIWYRSNTTTPQLFYSRYPSGGYGIIGYFGSIWKLTKYAIVDVYIGTVPTDAGWHQVAVSYSSSAGVTVYVDGQLNGVSTSTQNLVATNSITIGKAEFGTLDGAIGMVKIYNRVLSLAEIQQNFQAHRDRYGI